MEFDSGKASFVAFDSDLILLYIAQDESVKGYYEMTITLTDDNSVESLNTTYKVGLIVHASSSKDVKIEDEEVKAPEIEIVKNETKKTDECSDIKLDLNDEESDFKHI